MLKMSFRSGDQTGRPTVPKHQWSSEESRVQICTSASERRLGLESDPPRRPIEFVGAAVPQGSRERSFAYWGNTKCLSQQRNGWDT
ncbi:hypothetical protein TNCV_2282421 [Trichonephila clavipes]|nr:hypothetical protein TNCV_2282421 [Trichonephila clavipes]